MPESLTVTIHSIIELANVLMCVLFSLPSKLHFIAYFKGFWLVYCFSSHHNECKLRKNFTIIKINLKINLRYNLISAYFVSTTTENTMAQTKEVTPKNHLIDTFYTSPLLARQVMTTMQVKETMLATDNFITACGRSYSLSVKNIGAGMKEVRLKPF